MSYYSQVALDAPSAWWPLGEATTTAKDYSGNGRDLTWTVQPTQGSSLLPSRPSDGVTIGADKYATVADGAWVDPASITLEAWVKTTQTSLIAFMSHRPVSAGWAWYMGATGIPQLNDDNGSVGAAFDTVAVNDGKPHHIAVTAGAAGFQFYVDGTPTASGAHGAMVGGNDSLHVLGEAGIRRLSGEAAHFAIYPSILSAIRVKAHYEAGMRSGVVSG